MAATLTEEQFYRTYKDTMVAFLELSQSYSGPGFTRERALQEITSQTLSIISLIFTPDRKPHCVSREMIQLLVLKKIFDMVGRASSPSNQPEHMLTARERLPVWSLDHMQQKRLEQLMERCMNQEPVPKGRKLSAEYAAYYWGRTVECGVKAEEKMKEFLTEKGWLDLPSSDGEEESVEEDIVEDESVEDENVEEESVRGENAKEESAEEDNVKEQCAEEVDAWKQTTQE
ncbi:hypothetical protein QBC34DRAFT_398014 [Podospora aff. communis PSN243]|uniref:MAGE domain-containing protein n=1 Tax=Podospora aff. communis PSN243 TaxID=3040156 RepID=A0AAV9GWH7_9PEZI|nr:hypothetical protein QBC34DRAFT_398014 [Podospora aff. communis PSN243]